MSELERDALQNITLRSKREKDELRAENERLREDLRLAVMSDSEECKLLTAEIERLRSDNKLLQEDLDRCRAFYDAWMTARRALGGGNERKHGEGWEQVETGRRLR